MRGFWPFSTDIGLADYGGVQLQGCCSQSSLNSNGSLPGVGSHQGVPEQRVASWATCFERLLQDPVGVRYFSVRKGYQMTKSTEQLIDLLLILWSFDLYHCSWWTNCCFLLPLFLKCLVMIAPVNKSCVCIDSCPESVLSNFMFLIYVIATPT